MSHYFSFNCCRGRLSAEDLEQEGLFKVLTLIREGNINNKRLAERAIRNHMILIIQKNCSTLNVTQYGRRLARDEKAGEASEKAMVAMQLVIPFHELVRGEEAQSNLMYEFDETAIFAEEFTNSLSEREQRVLEGLLNGDSQRAISRDTGIPLITVRRACQSMKEKILRALGPGYEPA